MSDRQQQLCIRFERAGLGAVIAFVLTIAGSCWRQWPDRTTFRSTTTSTPTNYGGLTLIGVKQNSFVDHLRRIETIVQPRLMLLLLVGIALACAAPLVTQALSTGKVGRAVCSLGQLLGALLTVAGIAAAIDETRQFRSPVTRAWPLHYLTAAALAALTVVLARIGHNPLGDRRRRSTKRTKRPVPRPLNVAGSAPGQQ